MKSAGNIVKLVLKSPKGSAQLRPTTATTTDAGVRRGRRATIGTVKKKTEEKPNNRRWYKAR